MLDAEILEDEMLVPTEDPLGAGGRATDQTHGERSIRAVGSETTLKPGEVVVGLSEENLEELALCLEERLMKSLGKRLEAQLEQSSSLLEQ